MAVGRQDYQAGVVPIKSGYSLAQTQFFKWQNKNVAAAAVVDFIEYTVPTGYQLHIQGYRVFCTVPFINEFWIRVAGTQIVGRQFDTEITDNFPEGATMVVTAGKEFKCQVENKDTVTTLAYIIVYGYLEQIET